MWTMGHCALNFISACVTNASLFTPTSLVLTAVSLFDFFLLCTCNHCSLEAEYIITLHIIIIVVVM